MKRRGSKWRNAKIRCRKRAVEWLADRSQVAIHDLWIACTGQLGCDFHLSEVTLREIMAENGFHRQRGVRVRSGRKMSTLYVHWREPMFSDLLGPLPPYVSPSRG